MKGLSHLLQTLKTDVHKLNDYQLTNELNNISDTYEAMLRFLTMGVEDPNLSTMYSQLQQRACVLSIRCKRMERIAANPLDLYSISAKNLTPQATFENLLLTLESDTDPKTQDIHTIRLFHFVWTSDIWKRNDFEQAMCLLTSDSISVKVKSILVSAITYACLEYMDFHKMMLLFEAYLEENVEINQRAIIGIILVCRRHQDIISSYPEIVARLSLFHDDPEFRKDFFHSMIQLQLEVNTPRISDKMRNDIMPSLLNSSKMMRKKLGLIELNSEMTKNGENPDWNMNDSIDEKKAMDKMQEMADLQIDGADIYMSTFAVMKNYPFFNEIAHWFYPFDKDDASLGNISYILNDERGKYLLMLLNAGPFANSDKYSLCFMGNTLGEKAMEAFCSQIESQVSSQEDHESLIDSALNKKTTKNDARRRYVFDLYRFHKLFSRHPQFTNPFIENNKPVTYSPAETDIFTEFANDADQMLALAEFMIRQENYKEAIAILHSLEKAYNTNGEYWQKRGFCNQKLGDWQQALSCYDKADVIQSNSKWTLAHLGIAAINCQAYEKALEAYSQLIEMDPDSTKYINRKVECLISLSRYEDALPLLQKSHYLNDGDKQVKQYLALTYAILGKTDEALALYYPIDVSTSPTDFLTIGIIHLSEGKTNRAFAHLTQACLMDGFEQKYKELTAQFVAQGIIDSLKAELIYEALNINIRS